MAILVTTIASSEQVVEVVRATLRASELVVDLVDSTLADIPDSDLAPEAGPVLHLIPRLLVLGQVGAMALGDSGLDGGAFHLSTP